MEDNKTRINLGNGKYCYSGPNCRLHSPTGVTAAKKAIREASDNLVTAAGFADYTKAVEKLQKAREQYDMTDEGQISLQKEIDAETDHVTKALLTQKLEEAKTKAIALEKEHESKVEKVSSTFSTVSIAGLKDREHTYEEATYRIDDPESMYSSSIGSKYEGFKPVKEIARLVRLDLKEAQKRNYIPKGLKFSVTKDSFSGGSAIRVVIQGVPEEQIYANNPFFPNSYTNSDDAKELKSRVSGILNAYNSRSSHPEIDYSNNLYYSSVDIEDQSSKDFRLKEAERKKEARKLTPLKNEIKGVLKKNSYYNDVDAFKTKFGVTFENKNSDGVEYSRIKDSSLYAVKFVDNDYKDEYIQVYDLSQYEKDSTEKYLNSHDSKAIRLRMKKNRILG